MQITSKIKWAAWCISVGGIVSEIIPFFMLPPSFNKFLNYALPLLHTVYLTILPAESFILYFNRENDNVANLLNLVFYAALFAGVILYTRSKQKEVRLLRCGFSILLLFSFLAAISSIRYPFDAEYTMDAAGQWFIYVVNVAKSVLLTYLSWWILRALTNTRSVALSTVEGKTSFVEAPAWHRIFHLVADAAICVIIFSAFMYVIEERYLIMASAQVGENLVLLLLLAGCKMTYYLFFESILTATPAKFFSETRVVDNSGHSLSFSKALARTAVRFVPFDTLSFLSAKGWHDRWTDSQVVKEQRQGIAGIKYILLILLVLALVAAVYLAPFLI